MNTLPINLKNPSNVAFNMTIGDLDKESMRAATISESKQEYQTAKNSPKRVAQGHVTQTKLPNLRVIKRLKNNKTGGT